jgi:hypothetical protein
MAVFYQRFRKISQSFFIARAEFALLNVLRLSKLPDLQMQHM